MTSVKRDILERVAEKFKVHLEAKKNPIMAAVKFDRRRQLQGETFDSFVTDLKLLARGLEMTETNKLIRKAIACKLLDERVRQRCLDETDHSGDEYSSDEEGADRDLQLLHVASLEINRINDNQNPGEKDEWCEFLKVGNSTLFCQLDTGAYASVINTTQLRQIAPNARVNKTKKTLVSYSQHQIKPKGYVTLPVRFKDKELNVNFYVVDSKQKPILSGKVCQALDLVQRVRKIDVSLKELLNQHPDLQNASGVMPGTYSIKIDPTAAPVVHGPRRQPAALLSKIVSKL